MSNWYTYIVRCADQTLYTGVTTDLARRVNEHNEGAAAARYTRIRRPVTLVYAESQSSRATACQREAQIKRLATRDKRRLAASWDGAQLKQKGFNPPCI